MNAFIVAVNYTEELALTVPYNRHHFDNVIIITDNACFDAVGKVATDNKAQVVATDAFYAHGASFNKWLPLDMVLQLAKEHDDWMCLMDADILWPKEASLDLVKGQLYTPYRRMYPNVPDVVPPEETWGNYERHRNVGEFAGYSQVFHPFDRSLARCGNCDHVHLDELLCSEPSCVCHHSTWFQTDWVHAGGADSFFQRRWPPHMKIRPGWECLHLGRAGENWYGRSAPLKDGTVLPGSDKRRQAYLDIWPNRRRERDPQFRSERTARAD